LITSLNDLDAAAGGRFRSRLRRAILALEAVRIEAVSKVSVWQKMGIVARVAGQQAGRSRTFSAIKSAVRTTFRSFARAAHALWLEVTRSMFLAVAAFGFIGTFREYAKYHAGRTPASHVAIAAGFTSVFAWFGVTSFWRAARKSQR